MKYTPTSQELKELKFKKAGKLFYRTISESSITYQSTENRFFLIVGEGFPDQIYPKSKEHLETFLSIFSKK